MEYDEKLKIDLKIFSDPVIIDAGDSLILTPIYHTHLDEEAALYLINCKNDELKKFLPLVYPDNVEAAKNILIDFLGRTVYKLSLLYCIRLKENKFPVGYINFNTPIAETGLKDWSVDFWLGSSMRGQGIMTASLYYSLLYLKKYRVPSIKALVDKDNLDSVKVLEKVGFAFQEEEITRKRDVYIVKL